MAAECVDMAEAIVTRGETLSTAPCLRAADMLDPSGELCSTVGYRVKERLEVQQHERAYRDPMIDVLGAAHLLHEGKGDPIQLAANLKAELRSEVMEIIQAQGHLSTRTLPVNALGKTHVGGIETEGMFLRAVHPDQPRWWNRLNEINLKEETMSQAHFGDPYLRKNHMLVTASLMAVDEEPRFKYLRRQGFRPENKKWMIRSHQFVEDGHGGWERITRQLSLGGGETAILEKLYAALEVALPKRPHRLRRLGAAALRKAGIPRLIRTYDARTTQILDTPMLVDMRALPEGIEGIGHMSDQLLAEKYHMPFFCGKPQQAPPTERDYQALEEISQQRETEVDIHVNRLTVIASRLASAAHLSRSERQRRFNDEKIRILQELCSDKPYYAEHAFGKEAMFLYSRSKQFAESGNVQEAELFFKLAVQKSTVVAACGVEVRSSKGDDPLKLDSEAQHCWELSVFGFTMRLGVNCPGCGEQVVAIETDRTMECCNNKCGMKYDKGSHLRSAGVVRESARKRVAAWASLRPPQSRPKKRKDTTRPPAVRPARSGQSPATVARGT